MLCGFPPFYEENNQLLFEQIKKCQYDFPSPYWDDISDNAKDLIKKLLVVNPKNRLDADGIMNHPWITGKNPEKHMPEILKAITEFNAKRRLKRAGYMVIASVRFKNILKLK